MEGCVATTRVGWVYILTERPFLRKKSAQLLQQLNDANEREKKNLIRNLEQKIRLNVNGRSQADLGIIDFIAPWAPDSIGTIDYGFSIFVMLMEIVNSWHHRN